MTIAIDHRQHGEGAASPFGGGPSRALLRGSMQIAAAALIGFGLIFWIAAHWDGISRHGRLAIVASALAVAILVSLVPRVRVPGLLLSVLAAGGLFALIGQTYQTGADAWQLFAVWAAVTLPWAVASRHDAVWLVWSVVVTTAISLWTVTYSGWSWSSGNASAEVTSWAMVLALAAVLSPVTPLRPWIGATRWTFRLVVLVALAMIVKGGLVSILASGKGTAAIGPLAILVVAGVGAALVALEPLDLVLLAAAGLGLDVLLITEVGRALLTGSRDPILPMLLVGIVAAALVGATGTAILKIARAKDARLPGLRLGGGSPWPVILTTGVGALLAAVPLIAFLSLLLGPLLHDPGALVIGIAALAGSVAAVRRCTPTSFAHQIAVIGLAVGLLLIVLGLIEGLRMPAAPAALVVAVVAMGAGLLVGQSWSAMLLGAAAGGATVVLLAEMLATGRRATPGHVSTAVTLLLAAGSCWLAWRSTDAHPGRDAASLMPDGVSASPHRLVGGGLAAALVMTLITAGPTFLLSASVRVRPSAHATGIGLGWAALSPLSAIMAAAGATWLLGMRPDLRTALGLGAAAITVLMAAFVPALGALVLLLAVAATTGHRALAIGALAVALWVAGSFYYDLGWPLTDKAALMIGAGVALGVLCWMTGLGLPALPQKAGEAWPVLPATALVVAGALAVAVPAQQSVASHERTLATGRKVYLELAPVDPRSLIQGDYMALRFKIAVDVARSMRPVPGAIAWALATVDERGVATFKSVSEVKPTPSAGEVVLPLHARRLGWIVATDAWFFEEGTAEKWQKARFGEMRVSPNGTALLAGMADQDLQAIK
ncbi:MAG: GDYXXLXY domain-containing protein [Hyphomicrobiaceae bacterium]